MYLLCSESVAFSMATKLGMKSSNVVQDGGFGAPPEYIRLHCMHLSCWIKGCVNVCVHQILSPVLFQQSENLYLLAESVNYRLSLSMQMLK